MLHIALLAVLLQSPASAEDKKLNDRVQQTYIDPVLAHISNAANNGADPNAAAAPDFFANFDLSPRTRRAVDYVREKVIDPFTGRAANAAGAAAHSLASPDPNAAAPEITLPDMPQNEHTKRAVNYAKEKLVDPLSDGLTRHANGAAAALGSANPEAGAGLEEGIFSFPEQISANVTKMIDEIFGNHAAMSAPAAPLGETANGVTQAKEPLAGKKDFAYKRQDSLGFIQKPEGFEDAPNDLIAPKPADTGRIDAAPQQAAPAATGTAKKKELYPFHSQSLRGFHSTRH